MSVMQKPAVELKGAHVLAMILAFFAAIVAVDVGFSVVAINSFPGEDEKRSYLQGLHYNQTLEQRAAQRALGWRATAGFDAAPPAILVEITDATGAPVNAQIEGVLRRPVDARGDHTLRFLALGDGRYRAEAPNLEPGAWDLRAEAVRGEEHFAIERRLTWSPR